MINFVRSSKNPILGPNPENPWESHAAFNGSVIWKDGLYEILYRAMSKKQFWKGAEIELSVIGKAKGPSSDSYKDRVDFIIPDEEWDMFGCEDPRITFLNHKYYIFYTALSAHPPSAANIKVGLAISKDLETVDEKHLVTPFNAKAMTLFPEKINGKMVAVLTANTDAPPSKVALAYFDHEEQIWSKDYWDSWYKDIDKMTIPLQWTTMDQVEVGATPVKTPYGWLLIYCNIKDYFSSHRIVQIKAVLLDLEDPQKIVGVIKEPLIVPQLAYETTGNVTETIFPSGAIIENNDFSIFYSGADTVVCKASVPLKELYANIQLNNLTPIKFTKFNENPILKPIPEHDWEKTAVFNPTAIKLNNKIHLVYRAMGPDNTSTFGYAISSDGVHIDERLPDPIYVPREDFESKKVPGGNSGCEDPRVTQMGDTLYFCYTAYTGEGAARVAMTTISVEDFLARKWNWTKPVLITAPGIYDKDACIFPEKINGRYLFLHRITPGISVDYSDTLDFGENNWLRTQSYIVPQPHKWDDEKIGIGPTPVKTDVGWLLIYHGISKTDKFYRVGAMLLDPKNPQIVTSRSEYPILEPDEDYEKIGGRGIAFPCGMVDIGPDLYIYYGGGDGNICVAKIDKEKLLDHLRNQSNKKYLKSKS